MFDAGEQGAAQGVDVAFLAIGGRESHDQRQVGLPPGLQGLQESGVGGGHAGIGFDDFGDGAAVGNCWGEIGVVTLFLMLALSPGPSPACGRGGNKAARAQAGEVEPVTRQRIDFFHRHAAVQVGAHVVRLGRRGVVDVAADVAVVVFGGDFFDRHAAGVGRHIRPALGEAAVDVDDLGEVLRAQEVLRLAFTVFAVGIDKNDVRAALAFEHRVLLVHHQHAGGDAGAVEQSGGQADDGFEPAAFDEVLARFFLLAAAEQHAVRHDGGHLAVGLEHGQHVLHEHEVGLLALFGHPHGEAAGVFDVLLDVVLAEGRIGEYAVETHQLVVVGLVLGAAQGVFLADDGMVDAVQQHVHLADGPGGAHALLPE